MAKRSKRPASPAAADKTVVAAPAAPVAVTAAGERRTDWQAVSTVLSAAILIGAEVFGLAFAGGWAVANLLELGMTGVWVFQALFFVVGIAVMATFVRNAQRVEPFVTRG